MSHVIEKDYFNICVELIRYSKHAYVKDSQPTDHRYRRWRTLCGTVAARFWRSQPYLENDSIDVRSEIQTLISAQIAINLKEAPKLIELFLIWIRVSFL